MVNVAALPSLQPFPKEVTEDTPDGKYTITSLPQVIHEADGPEYKYSVWFQTPPLDPTTISKLRGVQLFARSRDQGFCDEPEKGNWTWFEIALLENEHSTQPRVKDGIELAWRSHRNRFRTFEPGWKAGHEFEEGHDLFRLLEDGNVIAVRLAARFTGWRIEAEDGYLVLELGPPVKRESFGYGSIVKEVNSMQQIFTEVNGSLFPESMQIGTVSDSLFKAEMLTGHNGTPLRVLSLDGGGVRGVAALIILDKVMTQAFGPDVKPCEVFDMIGGTSTGGFIAIMLGRFKMSIKECLEKYDKFMRVVFPTGFVDTLKKKKDTVIHGASWDPERLERVIKELITEKMPGQNPDEVLLMDEESKKDRCKVFCMAVSQTGANNHAPVMFRSYQNPLEVSTLPKIKLWEAARATSAAPTYFPPMTVDGRTFVDGGLQANNPLGWLWNEVLSVFGPARPTSCFLSIGTGVDTSKTLPSNAYLHPVDTANGLASIATNTEIINIMFRSLINAFAPQDATKKYWRFNVGDGLPDWVKGEDGTWNWVHRDKQVEENIGALDNVAVIDQTKEKTRQYLDLDGAKVMVDEAAQALNAVAVGA